MEHPGQIYFGLEGAAKAVRACCKEQLSRFQVEPTQFLVLCCLWQQDGMNPSTIARCIHLKPATITGVLQRLEKKNLVERICKVPGQRVVTVHLTPAGKALEQDIIVRMNALEEKLIGDIPEDELARCKDLLQKLERRAKER